jgi:hypothetical protein
VEEVVTSVISWPLTPPRLPALIDCTFQFDGIELTALLAPAGVTKVKLEGTRI